MTEPSQPLAPRDLLILAALADAPSHGYGLIKQVQERSNFGVTLDPANLYRVLRRMRQTAWIDEVVPQESGLAASNSRRRTYCITETGRTILAFEVTRLEQLLQQTRPALTNSGDR